MTRREISLLVPLLGVMSARQEDAQTNSGTVPPHCKGFVFEQLPVNHSASGTVSRPVMSGKLPTGEIVEMHETTLQPGQMPHPAHKHVHSEFMFIREGSVEFTGNDEATQLGPGGVAYASSGEMHSLKNVGSTPANYFVFALGVEPA